MYQKYRPTQEILHQNCEYSVAAPLVTRMHPACDYVYILARVYRCNTETSNEQGFPKTLDSFLKSSPKSIFQMSECKNEGRLLFSPLLFLH
jgi:hypothetical protein